jgi:zinc protease
VSRGLRRIRRVLPVAAMVVLACTVSLAQTLHLPPHERVVLKNGLTLLLLEKRGVPLVNLSAIVKAGAAADPARQEGLATTTAGLLRKGTKKRSAQQFAADLDYIGGEFEAEAGPDFTTLIYMRMCCYMPRFRRKRWKSFWRKSWMG